MATRLEPGQGISVQIDARKKWNATGIELCKGCLYQFEVSGEWCDAKIKCGPSGYESPNVILRWTERMRRVPNANWFSLIGALDSKPLSQFVIGKSANLAMAESGLLTCFANDLDFMYWNNHGSVVLEIRRMK